MNNLEREMIEVLKKLKNEYGVFEIKAEFEAEGSRMEEMMRLKDVTSSVGLPIIVKIGGVEAVTDIYNALSIGVKGIVAPMVETPFAMSKYINMIQTMVAEDNAKDIEFAFNMESRTALENLLYIINRRGNEVVSSMTIGRVDLSSSIGIPREEINTSDLLIHKCSEALEIAKWSGKKTALGGGISTESLPIIKELGERKLLYKFETRKVVFPTEAHKHGSPAILEAVKFELLWLKSKRRYYSRIKAEDEKRIEMLEARLK